LDRDRVFLDRLAQSCISKYPDKLEIYSFTEENIALDTLKQSGVDVLVAEPSFEIDVSRLPSRCGFAYLVDSPDIDTYRDQKTIFKYQKIESLYRNLLDIFSESIPDSVGIRFDGESSAKIIAFASPAGGAGGSTAAAACAKYFASRGSRVIYLNLETLGSTDAFFSGSGNATFNEVVFALKSKRSNLALKLESSVKRDQSGVCFFSASSTALDMKELKDDDVKRLLSSLLLSGNYDLVILDMDFGISDRLINVMKKSDRTVFVSDGSEISNRKLADAVAAFDILEKQMDIALLGRCAILYNKFSNKTGTMIEGLGLKVLGGAPRFEHASVSDIVSQMQKLNVFQEL
jgi:MinD-like ATPase involved in chromosome partitioning or flagellar assembly